ncbi:MAG: prolyl-tRNA synthetase associated domain-containing protein [Alphaproteobacteria bacterium]|nr:prolyl-tRNA synthetase associated domain-containing protein [Alphaproteobacteria bacterium]
MPTTRAQLFSYLEKLGIETTTVEHEAVFTVAESEKLHHTLAGGHTKNLFLKDAKGRLYLVVAECHAEIDMKRFHKLIGSARLSFGKPELLQETLGVSPGSVTAFSLVNDRNNRVDVIVDEQLMSFDKIYCHPLINTASTAISADDLLKFMRATGHDPRIMQLDAGVTESISTV